MNRCSCNKVDYFLSLKIIYFFSEATKTRRIYFFVKVARNST